MDFITQAFIRTLRSFDTIGVVVITEPDLNSPIAIDLHNVPVDLDVQLLDLTIEDVVDSQTSKDGQDTYITEKIECCQSYTTKDDKFIRITLDKKYMHRKMNKIDYTIRRYFSRPDTKI